MGCADQVAEEPALGSTQDALYGDYVDDAPGLLWPHGPVGIVTGPTDALGNNGSCSGTLIPQATGAVSEGGEIVAAFALWWDHVPVSYKPVLPPTLNYAPSESNRDALTLGSLRDQYTYVTAPLVHHDKWWPGDFEPVTECLYPGCELLLRPDLPLINPVPLDLITSFFDFLESPARVLPQGSALVAVQSPEDRAYNVGTDLGPGVAALIGSGVSWLTPVETEKTARWLGDRTHAVAISSPWTTDGLISPIVAGKGRLDVGRVIGGESLLFESAAGHGLVPSEREGARGLLTLSERSLLLVGGQRPDGNPTGEIWRYLLDQKSWQPIFWRQRTQPGEVLAAAYDPQRRRLVVIDEKMRSQNSARLYDSTVPGGYVDDEPDIGPGTRRRLLLFDTRTGEARVLKTCPRSKKVSRVALVARGDGSFLQLAFRASHHDWTAWRLVLDDDGEPVYDGKLKGAGDYLDDPVSTDAGVLLPLLDGGAQRLLTITDAMLGSGNAACNAF